MCSWEVDPQVGLPALAGVAWYGGLEVRSTSALLTLVPHLLTVLRKWKNREMWPRRGMTQKGAVYREPEFLTRSLVTMPHL